MRTWPLLASDPDFLAAATARDRRTAGFLDVVDEAGTLLARLGGEHDPSLPEVDQTYPGPARVDVTCDGDSPIRWTASIDLADDSLVPTSVGDLLHPLSWHRVRVWWSLWVPDWDAWAHVPCGTMYIDDPAMTEAGGPHVALSLALSDAAALVKAAPMPTSLGVGGLDAAEAAVQVLTADCPWLDVHATGLGHRLPFAYEAGEPDADPWEVAEGIVTSAGGRLYVDRMGAVVIEPATQGQHVIDLVEGPGCQATSVTPELMLDEVRNEVTVTSGARQDPDGEDLLPITSTWRDTDPTSPTRQDRGHVMRAEVITADEVVSQAQADDLARAHGESLRVPTERVTVEHLAQPWITPGEMASLSFSRVGASGAREVRATDLALEGMQRTELVGRRSW